MRLASAELKGRDVSATVGGGGNYWEGGRFLSARGPYGLNDAQGWGLEAGVK